MLARLLRVTAVLALAAPGCAALVVAWYWAAGAPGAVVGVAMAAVTCWGLGREMCWY